LTRYLNNSTLFYNLVDPNAWLVIGYNADTDELGRITERPTSFPLEIPAHAAFDYRFESGILKYLISCEKTYVNGEIIKEYYGFIQGIQVYVVELNKEIDASFYPNIEADSKFEFEKKTFLVYITETLSDSVPAMRFGYMPDYETGRETFVSVFDSATEEFKDLINIKSEYDLSLALHTFLQRMQMAEPCDHRDGNDFCDSGQMSLSRTPCESCKGSGLKIQTSSQDILLIKKPEADEAHIPLSEMVRYVEMPFEVVKHQSEVLAELPREISVAVFGVDITQRPVGNVTATAISNFFDSVYAQLRKFAENYSELYVFSVIEIAKNAELEEGLIVQHKFPQDFDLMTLGELLAQLDAAKKAGAPDEVIANIEEDIMSKQNQDNPMHRAIFRAKRMYKPFKGLSGPLLISTLAGLPNDNAFKIRYLFDEIIFSRVLDLHPDFVMLPQSRQMEIINEQVEVIRQENNATESIPLASLIKEMEDEEEEEDGE
jgi:hypothetical protein